LATVDAVLEGGQFVRFCISELHRVTNDVIFVPLDVRTQQLDIAVGQGLRERLYESVGKSLPVGRVGEAHDVAQAYLFLMQEGFSTGQTIVVDGGTVLV